MSEVGRRESERTSDRDLPSAACEQIGAANDIGNALCGIVHRHGELIGDEAIAPAHDDIAEPLQLEGLRPLDPILEADDLGVGDAEAQGCRAGPRRSVAAGAGIAVLLGTGELAARAAAGEGEAAQGKRAEGCFVVLGPAALILDFPVPLEAERLERAQNQLCAAGDHAWGVEVLHPHEPTATMASCIEKAT